MKTTLTLFFISVVFCRFSSAQECYTLNSSSYPLTLYDVIKSRDGGLIYSSTDVAGPSVLKTNSSGNIEWFHSVPLPFTNFLSIIETVDKHIVASVWDTGQNTIVFRMDADGNLLWSKKFEHSLYNIVSGLSATGDSGCIALTSGCGVIGNVVIKLDKNGNSVWQKDYISSNAGAGYISAMADNTSSVIVGMGFGLTGSDNTNVYLLKILHSDGSLVWLKTYDVEPNDFIAQVIATADGGFTFCGRTGIFQRTFPGGIISTYPFTFLLHTDASGDMLWSKVYHSDGNIIGGEDVIELDNGDYVLAGHRSDTSFMNVQSIGALAIRTDALGNIIWQKSTDNSNQTDIYGSNGIENMGGDHFVILGGAGTGSLIWDMLDASGFCAEIQENIIASAVTPVQTNIVASTEPEGDYGINISLNEVKLTASKNTICQLSTGIGGNALEASGFQISPNPFTSEFVLETDEMLQGARLKIFSLTGRLLYEKELNGNKFTIQTAFPPAMYIAEITSSTGNTNIQKIVKTN